MTARYDRTGTLLQTIRGDGGESVDVADSGDFLLAGFFPEQPGGSFLSRYDASGTRTWAKPISLGSNETLFNVAVRSDSTGAIMAVGTIRNVLAHQDDYLVIRFAEDGRELWRYRFNGPVGGDDRMAGLAIHGADAAVVTGTGCMDFVEVAAGPNTTTYTDGGLDRNTRYSYRIRAYDGVDTSPYSSTATAKTRRAASSAAT